MKILVLNPPSETGFIRSGRWTRKSRGNQQWYPIHLSYLTGFLIQKGYNCGLLDASASNMHSDIVFMYVTKVLQPDVIFYYWCYDNIDADLAFADLLAKYSKVILVGPWSFCEPNALLRTQRINIMTYGEFEHTCLALLETNFNPDTRGTIWRDTHNQLHTNALRPLCSSQELDAMPFVTSVYKDFLKLQNYRQTSFRFPFVDTLTSRGCPSRCTFCLWVRAFQNGPSYRMRSVKNVIEELWFIKNEMPEVKQIHLQDDTIPEKRAQELSQAMIDENLNITWSGYSRAELSFETLKLMKDSGLRTLHVGYETNDPKSLALIQKDITVARMEEFAHSIRQLDLWTCAGFMIYPWQTKDEVDSLIRWVKKTVRPRRFSFTQLFAYPNTPICKTLQEQPTNLSTHDMTKLEKTGFTQYYIRNPRWWLDTAKHPREWRNVSRDALGLLKFMRDKN